MKIKCIVSYDGMNYNGYQRQPGTKTIQGTIEKVLSKITKQDIIIYSSGRTDALVNAVGQVFHFDTDIKMQEENWKKAMNSLLPDDIYIKNVEFVDDEFHARYSLKMKEYRYYINMGEYNPFYNHFSVNVYNLNISLMEQAIKKFIGHHDFKGFAGDTSFKTTDRTIFEASIKQMGDFLEIRFLGDGFLKYMVRILVGTLIEIGLEKKTIDIIDDVFRTNDRNLAGKTAPANGLFLYSVYY